MTEDLDVVIIGAGQAGLSLSHELTHAGREHVVLDRGRVAETWRGRWDSFCLVIPNWTVHLAGRDYEGPEPDGFMPKAEIVQFLVDYAQGFQAPVREQVAVSSLSAAEDGTGFLLGTSAGDMHAREVVVASGGFQKPHRPAGSEQLPAWLTVMDATRYTNPGALPDGKVLIIGAAQTGCQLAEELFLAGRDVYVACGRAPWIPRRVDGRDMIGWIAETPFMEQTTAQLSSPMARLGANLQMSGREGGHDLNYRTLQAMGVTLTGRLIGVEDGRAHFADDLAESVAFGDARYLDICNLVREACEARGVPAPGMPVPAPFVADPPASVDLEGFGAAIITSGFRPDYRSWIAFPEAFDEIGFPIQADGSSTVVAGLHFMGSHFQRKRKSATLYGVGEDASVLAAHMAGKAGARGRAAKAT